MILKQGLGEKVRLGLLIIKILWRLAHCSFSEGAACPSEAQGHRAIRSKSSLVPRCGAFHYYLWPNTDLQIL
jgi:hypothetical protein